MIKLTGAQIKVEDPRRPPDTAAVLYPLTAQPALSLLWCRTPEQHGVDLGGKIRIKGNNSRHLFGQPWRLLVCVLGKSRFPTNLLRSAGPRDDLRRRDRSNQTVYTALRPFGGAKGLALRKFNGGNRPLPIMALDRDSQAVKFVKPDVFYRAGLSVCEDHGPSDQLRASLLERAEDRRS
jgi:hypothetical protein